jgi:hypothetical protein
MGVWYCTREAVKSALDSNLTARSNVQIDRLIESSSRGVEQLTLRKFYPQVATRYLDWPDPLASSLQRIWLDENELITLTSFTIGGVAIALADLILRPGDGPPYTSIEVNRSTAASFRSGSTYQNNAAVLGVFGFRADEAAAGQLAEALDNAETGVQVTDSAAVGTGSVLRVDDERMLVTSREWLDLGVTLAQALTERNNATTITLSATTAAVRAGETLLIGAERMLVEDVAGTTCVVKRAVDGSTIAAHDVAAAVWAPRDLTVTRGALGTAKAAHSLSAPLWRHEPPAPVQTLTLHQTLSGLGMESGTKGQDLKQLRDDVLVGYGRRARTWAV